MNTIKKLLLITIITFLGFYNSLYADDVWYKDATSLTNAFNLSKEEKIELGYGDTSLLKKASDALKQNKAVVLDAVKRDPRAFQYAHNSLKKDKAFILSVVREQGSSLKYADAGLQKNKEVVLAAVLQSGSSLEFADKTLKRDKEIVIAALKNSKKYPSLTFQWADKSFRSAKDVMLVVVGLDGSLLRFADNKLKKDKEVVLAAVLSFSGVNALKYVDDTLLKDRVFLLSVARELYAKKEIIFQGESHDISEMSRGYSVGRMLEKIDSGLNNDKEFITKIVASSNVFALINVDKKLKRDEKFMLELAKKIDLRALLFVDKSLLESNIIMRELDFFIMQLVDNDKIKFKELKLQIVSDIRKSSNY